MVGSSSPPGPESPITAGGCLKIALVAAASFGAIPACMVLWTVVSARWGAGTRPSQMDHLIAGRPHSPLVEVVLRRHVGPPVVIDDPGALRPFQSRKFRGYPLGFHPGTAGSYPYRLAATFTFRDGSWYDCEIMLPDRNRYLILKYPLNPFGTDEIDDDRASLDLDGEGSGPLVAAFQTLGAFRDDEGPRNPGRPTPECRSEPVP